jgi:hypothetical protein
VAATCEAVFAETMKEPAETIPEETDEDLQGRVATWGRACIEGYRKSMLREWVYAKNHESLVTMRFLTQSIIAKFINVTF